MQIGLKGSPAHILTNDNMGKAEKKACFKELLKENVKDTCIITGAVGGAAAIKGGALGKAKAKIGELLSKVNIKDTNLKNVIKESSLYKKGTELVGKLPAGAIKTAAVATLVGIAGIVGLGSMSKAGYIEGKHEIKE